LEAQKDEATRISGQQDKIFCNRTRASEEAAMDDNRKLSRAILDKVITFRVDKSFQQQDRERQASIKNRQCDPTRQGFIPGTKQVNNPRENKLKQRLGTRDSRR